MATQKDYKIIAAAISEARGRRDIKNPLERVLFLQRILTDALKEQNPRFDERKFEIACMSKELGQCNHSPFNDNGRCAEMTCSNYVNKHLEDPIPYLGKGGKTTIHHSSRRDDS